jgi:hypothetical protein
MINGCIPKSQRVNHNLPLPLNILVKKGKEASKTMKMIKMKMIKMKMIKRQINLERKS